MSTSILPTSPLQAAEIAESRGEWSVARDAYEHLLRRGSEDLPPALLLRRIARCHIEKANFDAAVDCLAVARAAADVVCDRVGVAHADNLLGIAAQQRGELDAAEEHYQRARAEALLADERRALAMIDLNLGTVLNIRGDFDGARRHYEASLSGFESIAAHHAMRDVLNNLGMLHTDCGEWAAADRCFSRARRLAAEAGDTHAFLRTEANRVELYVAQRRFKKARALCRDLIASAPPECEAPWLGEAYKHFGVLCRELGDQSEAERRLHMALAIGELRHDALLIAETLRELGFVYSRQRRYQDMLAVLNRAHTLFEQLRASRDMFSINSKLRTLESQFLEVVRSWGASIESVDQYTQGHCERVADLACGLARDAGLDERMMLWFRMGALLHDVGKITVPVSVLNKPDTLTPTDVMILRGHAAAGEALVAEVEFPWDIKPMIRHHHERWDGSGYPDGLSGDEIPLAARILCIADVFDALTSTRSYRPAYSSDQALRIMAAERAGAFDPGLLDIFVSRTLPAFLGHRDRIDPVEARMIA